MSVTILHGDCLDILPMLAENSVDAVVTDPPYHLTSIVKRFGAENAAPAKFGTDGAYARASRGFMGKQWDGGDIAFRPETWVAIGRVLKPGGHLLSFGGTRTYHRMACAIEDAGFEIRDTIMWVYGSGFPKSHDISKAVDRAAGAEREKVIIPAEQVRNPKATGAGRDGMDGATRPWIKAALATGYHEKDGDHPVTAAARQWEGWGTALKPAVEPIVLARKPLSEKTVAANVLAHGTGALNIDGCRIATGDGYIDNKVTQGVNTAQTSYEPRRERRTFEPSQVGRWPANLIHDGSEEAVAAFPETTDSKSGIRNNHNQGHEGWSRGTFRSGPLFSGHSDSGSAARFFYTAKADAGDRLGSKHPTVKPVDLMAYLCRLVTPPGGTVLDPFAGSGTTGMACMREGFNAVLIEREAEYVADIRRRLAHVKGEDAPLFKGIQP